MTFLIVTLTTLTVAIGSFVAILQWRTVTNNGNGDDLGPLLRSIAGQPRIRVAGVILAVSTGLVIVPALEDRLCRLLPYLVQRHLFAFLWLPVLATISGGFSYLLVAAILRKDRQSHFLGVAATVVIGLVLLQTMQATVTWQGSPTDLTTADGIVLQSSGFSCVAACVANVARLDGKPLTESKAAQLLGTSTSGTTNGGLRYALHDLQIPFRETSRSLPANELSPPAILSIDHPATGPESHAVLLRQIHAEKRPLQPPVISFEIWDPLRGAYFLTPQEIDTVWHGAAFECRIQENR
ncbi:MAG: hypothetical protein KDA96_02430 [Planctomycetaceae bacterium]|nr:hypothetical protein [Planctomycetaceae bacterium]